MSEVLRFVIEQSLETMEAGRFQDFCLEFLPLYDPRFEGLSRVGHTAGGKTRPGTPDLLKTDASGQTGVQCGTDEDYWPSEDSVDGSKPYEDGLKCVRALERLVELVLVTNRETPARTPNIKLLIATALRAVTEARISLLGREDLSQFLITHLEIERVKRLIAKFFPMAAGALEAGEHAERLRVLSAVAAARSVDIRTVLPLIDEALIATPGMDAATEYVLDRLDELSRCRLSALPTFAGVLRTSVAELSLARPHGRIWMVTGVPKVGKTNLVVQLAAAWSEDSAVWWFDCPLIGSEECAAEIAGDLVRLALPHEATPPLLRSPAKLEAALTAADPARSRTVIIVDNADRLPAAGLHRLGEVLKLMRRHGALANVACVFISARRLGPLRSALDETVMAPAWTSEELGLLLDHVGIPWARDHREEYLDLLLARSGGHPLLAQALVRRHAGLPGLLLSMLEGAPSLGDEELSREAQHLLYEELLTDADAQNLVQRLSLLLERSPTDVLEVLRSEVTPAIPTSIRVLLDRLNPSVIEGSDENGFEVAFVFREIARQMISEAEQRAVYHAVADRLLTPRGRTVVAERTCAGILYGVLAGDIGRSVFWTTILLKRAMEQRLSEAAVAGLLSRLAFMTALRPPDDLPGRFGHAVMLLTISQAYVRVGQREKAVDVLSQATTEDPGGTDAQQLRGALPQLRFVLVLSRATNLLIANRDGALAAIESLGPGEYATVPLKQWPMVLELFVTIMQREGISGRTPRTLRAAIERLDVANGRCRTAALRVAAAVGFAISRAQAEMQEQLTACFPANSFGALLEQAARGVLFIERDDGQKARESLEAAVTAASAQGWTRGSFWSDLQAHLGDAARVTRDNAAAVAAYAASRAAGSVSSFMWAWSSWRLGLLREDVAAFADAAEGFQTLGLTPMWARAVGARGALLLRSGQDLEGLRCFASIVDAYYGTPDKGTDGKSAGPAVTVAGAQLQRYSAQREGRPIENDDSMFPQLGPAPYDLIPETAVPRAGPVVAYFSLGEAFKRIGSEADARRCLALAADAVPENETDKITLPLVISTLISVLGASESDRTEIRRRFQQFLTLPRTTESDALFARLIFAQDQGPSAPTDGGLRLDALVTSLDHGLAEAQVSSDFWRAEVLGGRARLGQARREERKRIVLLWSEALAKAREGKNSRILLQAGQALGFEFAEHARSFLQLANYQLECLRGAELEGVASFEFLGANLFTIWSRLDYRRLSENDLEPNRMLRDSATAMNQAGLPPAIARPVMVLLLARLHNHHGSSTEWAMQQLVGHLDRLPPDVRARLEGSRAS